MTVIAFCCLVCQLILRLAGFAGLHGDGYEGAHIGPWAEAAAISSSSAAPPGWGSPRRSNWPATAPTSRCWRATANAQPRRPSTIADHYHVRAVGIGVDAARTRRWRRSRGRTGRRRSGPLRGLAVTAGPMKQQGPFLEHGDDSWDWYYQMILMATVRSCRAIIPHLQRNGGGTVVTTAAYSVRAPKILIPPYNALKAAVLTMSKILAKTHGPDGIRVNTVCPGLFDTEVNDFIRAQRAEEYGVPLEDAIYTHLASNPAWNMRVALDRGGRPHEAGELIAFLLSDRAAYMTGAVINIDGGTDF